MKNWIRRAKVFSMKSIKEHSACSEGAACVQKYIDLKGISPDAAITDEQFQDMMDNHGLAVHAPWMKQKNYIDDSPIVAKVGDIFTILGKPHTLMPLDSGKHGLVGVDGIFHGRELELKDGGATRRELQYMLTGVAVEVVLGR